MLTFILKKEWYDKIKNGEKTIEYREVKPYWDRRICKYKNWYSQFIAPKNRANFRRDYPVVFTKEKAVCILRLGCTNKYMTAIIKKIEIVNGKNTDLHIDKPVFAIHFMDAMEISLENWGYF